MVDVILDIHNYSVDAIQWLLINYDVSIFYEALTIPGYDCHHSLFGLAHIAIHFLFKYVIGL
jgi:hypothetical protein